MKALLLFITAITFCFDSIGQTRTVLITTYPQTVPSGKKWILESGIKTRMTILSGVYNSGSICNALFLSNPRITFGIKKGSFINSVGYEIIFKDLETVPYSNNLSFDFIPITFLDQNFSLSELKDKDPKQVGFNILEFKAGENVFVDNCLASIEFKEVNMTEQELSIEKQKENTSNKIESEKTENFNIPINLGVYVEPGTKPTYHNLGLKSIVFSSTSVVWKGPQNRYSLDDGSSWIITLTTGKVILNSTGGIDKTYQVSKIQYDETTNSQKFYLTNSDNVITHSLLVSWQKDNEYSLRLISIDDSEDYQFQNVLLKSKL